MITTKPESYKNVFAKMKTEHLQLWLHLAQNDLPNKKGNDRTNLMAGISAAASELLYRWRCNL